MLDTDYTSYGLICTCQEIDLFITTVGWMMIRNVTKLRTVRSDGNMFRIINVTKLFD